MKMWHRRSFKSPRPDLNIRGTRKSPMGSCNILGLFNYWYDEKGQPYCVANVPLIFWGYDKEQKAPKYRCPLACGKQGCLSTQKCSESQHGYVVKTKLQDDYRRFIQIPRHTPGGIDNVHLHCPAFAIATQSWALALIKLGKPERIRSCVQGIAQTLPE